MIQINAPVELLLKPQDVANVLDALAELPYKRVQGTIAEIFRQIKELENDRSPNNPPGG